MKMIINKRIGKNNYMFEFEGTNLHNVVMEAQKLSFSDVYKCGLCESDALELSAYRAGDNKEYDYTTIRCRACGAKVTFGEKKDKSAIFLRKNDDKKLDWTVVKKQDNDDKD